MASICGRYTNSEMGSGLFVKHCNIVKVLSPSDGTSDGCPIASLSVKADSHFLQRARGLPPADIETTKMNYYPAAPVYGSSPPSGPQGLPVAHTQVRW